MYWAAESDAWVHANLNEIRRERRQLNTGVPTVICMAPPETPEKLGFYEDSETRIAHEEELITRGQGFLSKVFQAGNLRPNAESS